MFPVPPPTAPSVVARCPTGAGGCVRGGCGAELGLQLEQHIMIPIKVTKSAGKSFISVEIGVVSVLVQPPTHKPWAMKTVQQYYVIPSLAQTVTAYFQNFAGLLSLATIMVGRPRRVLNQ
jgi:hypothetical protein